MIKRMLLLMGFWMSGTVLWAAGGEGGLQRRGVRLPGGSEARLGGRPFRFGLDQVGMAPVRGVGRFPGGLYPPSTAGSTAAH